MQSQPFVLTENTPPVVRALNKQRNAVATRMQWVDYARGLAILLVVYRHTMVGLNRAGNKVPDFLYYIQEFAVNFRMPVFFILSGIFLAKTFEKYPVIILIKKKAKTLLYPYLLWTVILITLQILLSNYTNSERTTRDYLYILAQPRNLDHMWYLLALFNTSVLFVLIFNLFKNNRLLHIAFAVFLHIVSFFIRDYSLFSDAFYYYIFLVTGFLISKQLLSLENRDTRFTRKMLLVILPVFVVGQIFWLGQGGTETLGLLVPYLLVIFVACFFFYFLCRVLHNAGIALWLTRVGQYSLYIYILHILVISAFRILSVNILQITNVYFLIAGSLVLGILLPIMAYRASSRWGLWYLFSLEKPKPSS